MQRTLLTVLVLAALPAMAQDWAILDSDVVLTADEMQQSVVGQDLTFYDNGVSRYAEDGAYSYTYDGGGTALGTYEMRDDGVICTAFLNGFSRCDMIVRSGERLVVITEKGDRFPVRP
jgi:hypothetical protein